MIGCCCASRKKFIHKDGSIDQLRLDAIVNEWKEKKIPEDVLKSACSELSSCRCPCHKDGTICLC
jgi:hypothetical protein